MKPSHTFHLSLIFAAAALTTGTTVVAEDREHDPTSFSWHPERSTTGAVVVRVHLKSQTANVYRNGVEIGNCIVATGRKGHETPTGSFQILQKDADHHSSTYNNASMPFSERLTWSGVALHAGNLPGYPSSHGCIHLPYDFSKKLFGITSVGGTVIISDDYGPASHGKSPKPKPAPKSKPKPAVTKGHRIEFVEHEKSDIHWAPHASPAGPVAVRFSSEDEYIQIIRNGVLIGGGSAHLKLFADKPNGTHTYIFDGWSKDSQSGQHHPHWHQVAGPPEGHLVDSFGHIKCDPRLKHLLDSVAVPGTVLIMTDRHLSKANQSKPGFRVMSTQPPVKR
ncbi:MAG: L,D-transpeptidase family protein [Verrucomicrobiales bacterium]